MEDPSHKLEPVEGLVDEPEGARPVPSSRRELGAMAVAGSWQRAFARLTEDASEAFALLSEGWRFRLLGGAAEAVLGSTGGELAGRFMLERVHPADRQRVGRTLAEAQEAPGERPSVVYRWRVREGGYVEVRSTVSCVVGDPALEGLVVTSHRHERMTRPPAARQVEDRATFVGAVARAASQADRGFAVLVVEVSDYRAMAAAMGHELATKVVRYAGKRIHGAVNELDMVAQVGVDAFAVLLGGVQDEERVRAVAERLRARLRTPFHVAGHELIASVSIGFATSGHDFADAEAVLASAEAAAHRAGPTELRAYRTPIRQGVQRHVRLAAALPRALQRNELQIRYQPVVRVADETLSGFEALMRWMHPELGLVSPGEFIPLAEQLDWIVQLDRWMLGEAVRHVATWRGGRPFRLGVNVSGRHLDDPSLVETVASALGASGLMPDQLRIEVTETAVANEPRRSAEALRRLKALGVGLAIDDFGTGYASLAMLADMPFDVLKVDMSFVRKLHDPQSRAVVHNIVAMAHDLSLEVVAEGVETREQLEHLRAMGCDHVQGYLFAKPLTSDEARAWLREGAP
jgi:diguanylate cyclase (GGDEF)-like protein